ncbi:MAG: ABC transporter [Nocardioidaceae bacterium]
MSAPATTTDMITALVRLREALQAAGLSLDMPGVEAIRVVRDEMVDQLEDYVLPRLIQIDAPLLAVVGGSTGAGKSTLVNSLVGRQVTEPGVLRPTTRSPVLVHNPADADWFAKDRILPDLARTTGATGDPGALQLVASDTVPPGLAILDAPDIDSVEEHNRTLAAQLLAAADLWVFVTSAARYADQVPWDFLKAAAERSTAVAVVLDRTAPEAVEEVSGHLARMLTARGLRDSPLFTVTEAKLGSDGLLPAENVAEIHGWLASLAADADARAVVVKQTLDGAVRNIARRTYVVADAAAEQATMLGRLRKDVERAYDEAATQIDKASADGTLLRGEVLARWQEFIGTGELLKSLETKVSWLRDRVVGAVRGRPQQVERVTVAVESGLETLILEHAETAAERADASWRSVEAGQHLVEDSGRDLGRASRDFRARTERAVRDWQHDVLEMVRTEGASKKSTARVLAFGVNGLGVALMIVVFAHTAGITGAEAGIAGGSAVIGQKLLEAVFGDQAVRRLAEQARQDLRRRVEELLNAERERYLEVLDDQGIDPEAAERMRQVSRKVDDLRFASQLAPESGDRSTLQDIADRGVAVESSELEADASDASDGAGPDGDGSLAAGPGAEASENTAEEEEPVIAEATPEGSDAVEARVDEARTTKEAE